MNKYLTLFILIIIINFFYFIIENHQAIDIQEISVLDDQISEYPLDDNGKLKGINGIIELVTITIMTSSIKMFYMFSILTRRLMVITTIFYQSNYLINSFE